MWIFYLGTGETPESLGEVLTFEMPPLQHFSERTKGDQKEGLGNF